MHSGQRFRLWIISLDDTCPLLCTRKKKRQTENLKIVRFWKTKGKRQTQQQFKTNPRPFFSRPDFASDFSLDQHQPVRSFKSSILIVIPTSKPTGAIFNILLQSRIRFPECTRWPIKNSALKPNERDLEVKNYKPKTLSGVHLLMSKHKFGQAQCNLRKKIH